jgi:hypothetical protein
LQGCRCTGVRGRVNVAGLPVYRGGEEGERCRAAGVPGWGGG